MREWLRQLQLAGYNPITAKKLQQKRPILQYKKVIQPIGHDYSQEVYNAMSGCLGCKACATQCPIHVDIPELKAKFLELYHTRYPRAWRDHLVANLENHLPLQARFSSLTNWVMSKKWVQKFFKNTLGLVNLPPLHPDAKKALQKSGATCLNLKNLPKHLPRNAVILLQDPFTTFYDTSIFINTCQFIQSLGFQVFVPPYIPNGKGLHVKGFLQRFKKLVTKNQSYLQKLSNYGVPLLGIDPSVTLTYRNEYQTIAKNTVRVELLQEWLASIVETAKFPKYHSQHVFKLFSHCTEKTALSQTNQLWQKIFSRMGLTLEIVETGCCGMAGTYGHETEHLENSQGIYNLSWATPVEQHDPAKEILLATGFSCRCQVKRFSQTKAYHPLAALCMLNAL